VPAAKQVVEQLRVHQDIAVHHHETVGQQRASEPQRIHAVGLYEVLVLDERDTFRRAPHGIGGAADHDHDIVDAGATQQADVAREQGLAADRHQALGHVAVTAVETRPASGGKNDPRHECVVSTLVIVTVESTAIPLPRALTWRPFRTG
jgi:hypothetical protein